MHTEGWAARVGCDGDRDPTLHLFACGRHIYRHALPGSHSDGFAHADITPHPRDRQQR